MARLVNTLTAPAPFYGTTAQIVDIKQGGQFGHMMDYKALVSSTPYVRQHLIPVVIEAPTGFDLFPDSDRWKQCWKAIIEEQSKEISGLDSKLSIENHEHEVGGAGEKIGAPSNVTRAQSKPQHTIHEKYNMPVTLFFNTWILELIGDPETKYPNIITRPNITIPDLLVDVYSGTVLYIEPDPTFQYVLKAWLCFFMRPEDSGPDVQGERNLTSAKGDLSVQMTFSAVTQVGAGVNQLAQTILSSLSVKNTNPWQRPAGVEGIAAGIDALTDTGYKQGMDNAAQVAVDL